MSSVRNVIGVDNINIQPNSDGTFQTTIPAFIGKIPRGTIVMFNGSHTGTSPITVNVTTYDNSTGAIFGTTYPKAGSAFETAIIVLSPIS